MRLHGLYTKIGLRLGLLLTAAMIMIDVAVFMAVQKAMVQEKIASKREFLHAWRDMSDIDAEAAKDWGEAECLIRYDADLAPIGLGGCPNIALAPSILEQLCQGHDFVAFDGRAWGLFWPQPRTLVVGVVGGGRAAIGVWSLTPIYQTMRRMQPAVAGYMVVNLLLLELVGLYLLGRITAKPLQRLRRRAETFSGVGDEDLFLGSTAEGDDYGQLSQALNRLYGHMKRDRAELAMAVEHLEAANLRLRKAQEEVLRAEKLAAVGRLSAGLAHEIGNPLGIVSGYLELLGQESLPPHERRDVGRRAVDEVERIGRILRQLLDLARSGFETTETTEVHELIRETAEVFAYQPLTAAIRLSTELVAACDRVHGDHERLRQVFLNLMINAADAIRARCKDTPGELRIRTQNAENRLQICFEDDGTGIAPEDLSLIFDPFFTTKAPGEGTGLGLAVSYMIVEAFGGRISVHSEVGVGTRMQIDLPLAGPHTFAETRSSEKSP
jgi:signal transduction histidine kinase